MKKQYAKPELNTKAYAQFENVFTACNKGNAKSGCSQVDGTLPGDSYEYAAYKDNGSC